MTTILSASRQNITANVIPSSPQIIYSTRTEKPSLAKVVHAAAHAVDECSLISMISSDSRAILNPKPLLALVCLAYAQGVYSSRDIETVLQSNRELQQACGSGIVDASVLSRFRNDNWNAIRSCLVTVLWFMAEQKIAQAEAQAVQEVKALSADVAIAAAEKILAAKVKGEAAEALIKTTIADLRGKLN